MWRYIPGRRKPHDSWAYVIYVDRFKRSVHVIGDRYFILMEFSLRPNVELMSGEKIYVGKGQRKEVSRFLRYLSYDDLPSTAKFGLEQLIINILKENERFFVEFFNESVPITPRLHQLELLPGVGKKTMMKILEERQKKRFESYEDVEKRTGLKDPLKSLAQRVLEELSGNEKYYILVAPKKLLEEEITW